MTEKQSRTREQAYTELRAEIDDNYGEDEIKAYIGIVGAEYATADEFLESYQGKYASDEEFAQETAEQVGYIPKDLHWPYTCIDWEWAARELMMDYSEADGFYFRNM